MSLALAPGQGSGMAAVEDHGDIGALGCLAQVFAKLIVDHETITGPPVHVEEADQFIDLITKVSVRFVTVEVADVRAMTREMQDELIALLGAVEQPTYALLNPFLNRAAINQQADVVRTEIEVPHQ